MNRFFEVFQISRNCGTVLETNAFGKNNDSLRGNHPNTIFRGAILQVVILHVEFVLDKSSGGQSFRGQSSGRQSSGAQYIGANIARGNFMGGNFPGGNLLGAICQGAILRGTILWSPLIAILNS